MADKKISALPPAATPLAGTEALPIVQSGVTDQVTVANLTAGRDVAVKKLNPTDNVVMTAGKGIDFSANANAPGMTSELLNWYEEGTWTPTYVGWATSPTTDFAKYTRIGRVVTLNFTAHDGVSLTGSSEIRGLPFTSNSQQGASVLMKDISGAAISAFGGIGANTNAIGAITSATFTGLYWSFSVSYIV